MIKMYSAIARHILFPIAEVLQGTKMLNYLKELEKTQWWSLAQLQELQNEKLRNLIKHAYNNTPYYRRIFNERGLTDKDIQSIDDLPKLPILTKDDVRKNFEDLMSQDSNKRRSFLNSTSGSTGEPFKYYIDMEVTSINWAGMFRGWEWAKYKLGDKRATLAGSSLVPNEKPTLKKRARGLLERNLSLSAFEMNDSMMANYAEKLSRYKSKFIRGYASAIYLFANYLKGAGINTIKPKAIFTTAEMLLPQYREIIEKQFGCRVFDQYGCYDGGPQAMECTEHNGLHISVEKTIMEFINEQNEPVSPGCPGEILATDLHNYTMPFIRYAVGDVGILSANGCPCGRGLPLMESIQGRVSDFITTPRGERIHGEFFSHIFWEMTSFMQFQVVQESTNSLIIKVMPFPNADKSNLQKEADRILQIVRMRTGDMQVDIKFTEEISTTEAGKWRFIVSNIA